MENDNKVDRVPIQILFPNTPKYMNYIHKNLNALIYSASELLE